jgi:anti-sigma factor (TIGR02949 family)
MTGDQTMDAMLTCDEVMRQLWDYLDHELTPERMTEIAAHLSMCNRCFPQYDFERAFLRAVREAAGKGHAAPPPLRERVLTALRAEGLTDV